MFYLSHRWHQNGNHIGKNFSESSQRDEENIDLQRETDRNI